MFLTIVTKNLFFPVGPELATSREYRAARELSGVDSLPDTASNEIRKHSDVLVPAE